MSARAFHDAMQSLVENDATFGAAIEGIFGAGVSLTVLHGNRPVDDVAQHQMPAFVMVPGEAEEAALAENDDEPMTIGHQTQGWRSTLDGLVVFHDRDPEAAYDKVLDLSEAFGKLLLRNPAPGAIAHARMTGWRSDRGANHPTQVMLTTFDGFYELQKT